MEIVDDVLVKVTDLDIENGTFRIPSNVTIIGNWAFLNCDSLKYIEIPDNVTMIRDCAFCECRYLEKLE